MTSGWSPPGGARSNRWILGLMLAGGLILLLTPILRTFVDVRAVVAGMLSLAVTIAMRSSADPAPWRRVGLAGNAIAFVAAFMVAAASLARNGFSASGLRLLVQAAVLAVVFAFGFVSALRTTARGTADTGGPGSAPTADGR